MRETNKAGGLGEEGGGLGRAAQVHVGVGSPAEEGLSHDQTIEDASPHPGVDILGDLLLTQVGGYHGRVLLFGPVRGIGADVDGGTLVEDCREGQVPVDRYRGVIV